MFPGPQLLVSGRRLLALAAIAFLCLELPVANPQSEISDVHIPRVQSGLTSALSNSGLNTIRAHAELVLVPVTVTDPMNRVAVGLEQGNFQLYEGKQSQEIKHFSREDAPVSLGVILDVSGSMASKIERVREAVLTLLEESNPQDEFFLITFADRMWSRTSPRRSRKCKDSCSLHARRDERRCSMRFIWGWTK